MRHSGAAHAKVSTNSLSFIDAVHPDDQARGIAALEGHAKDIWDIVYRIIRPDGTERWISDRGFPVHDERGELVNMRGVAADITKYKQAEKKLQTALDELANSAASMDYLKKEIAMRNMAEKIISEQSKFLSTVINSISNPFCVINTSDYTIETANKMAGLDYTETGITTCHKLTHDSDDPCAGANICPLEEIKKKKTPVVVEHTFIDKEGNEKNIEIYAYPVFDENENVSQVIEYSVDNHRAKAVREASKAIPRNPAAHQ